MSRAGDLVVTGLGAVVLEEGGACDPAPLLKVRKSRKFMGVQDDLAVVAAGRALAEAGLGGAPLGERAGLYVAVGYIPFRGEDIDPVLAASLDDEGRFSMRRFSEGGFQKAHPLLTFRCLPNMPAYHVSVNFDVQGPYLVTYPGGAQLYRALEEAAAALSEGRIDRALVGGVAHQRNFLVEHHFARALPPVAPDALRDAGAFLVLETRAGALARGAPVRGQLERMSSRYAPFDPTQRMPEHSERISFFPGGPAGGAPRELGPASLFLALADAWSREGGARVEHALSGRDGITVESAWVGGP